MELITTSLESVHVLRPARFGDDRGWFCETWSARTLSEHGLDLEFCQDNESMSAAVGTIRGLHYQLPASAQGKLVRVVSGAVLDVAVDIRLSSPTFGQHVAVELSADNGEQLWVPPGFAHGFCTRKPNTIVAYKVTGPYDREADRNLAFDDPELGIDWGVTREAATLSERDRVAPSLATVRDNEELFP